VGMILFWGINAFAVFSGAWLSHVKRGRPHVPVILATAE
jgi:hypothetical protein